MKKTNLDQIVDLYKDTLELSTLEFYWMVARIESLESALKIVLVSSPSDHPFLLKNSEEVLKDG